MTATSTSWAGRALASSAAGERTRIAAEPRDAQERAAQGGRAGDRRAGRKPSSSSRCRAVRCRVAAGRQPARRQMAPASRSSSRARRPRSRSTAKRVRSSPGRLGLDGGDHEGAAGLPSSRAAARTAVGTRRADRPGPYRAAPPTSAPRSAGNGSTATCAVPRAASRSASAGPSAGSSGASEPKWSRTMSRSSGIPGGQPGGDRERRLDARHGAQQLAPHPEQRGLREVARPPVDQAAHDQGLARRPQRQLARSGPFHLGDLGDDPQARGQELEDRPVDAVDLAAKLVELGRCGQGHVTEARSRC